jgi:hypothetical protein
MPGSKAQTTPDHTCGAQKWAAALHACHSASFQASLGRYLNLGHLSSIGDGHFLANDGKCTISLSSQVKAFLKRASWACMKFI